MSKTSKSTPAMYAATESVLSGKQKTGSNQGRTLMLSAIGALLINALLMVWAHVQIDDTLRRVIGDLISGMLDTEFALYQQWQEGELDMVSSWVEQSRLQEQMTDLKTQDSERALQVRNTLNELSADAGFHGFFLLSREGKVLLASESSMESSLLRPDGVRAVAQTLESGPQIGSMIFFEDYFSLPEPAPPKPYLPLMVPVDLPSGHHLVLLLLLDPETEMADLFNSLAIGHTMESFAFNREGLLISDSWRLAEARTRGMLLNPDMDTAILNLPLRVPGKPAQPTGQTADQPGRLPFTEMASAALQGDQPEGIDLEGYLDFRGKPVMGAWRWSEEDQLGIAVEIDRAEALALIRPLRIAQIVIGLILAAAIIVIGLFLRSNHRLRKQMSQIERMGQYRLGEKIGAGGMGEVYKATHARLQRPTAMKLIKPGSEPELLARFEREVQLTSQLTHPNTVEIWDFGQTSSGRFYYVMEYIEGVDLARLIEKEGPQPAARVIYLLNQICGSLAEAHESGIIHRDIKPLNLMVCRRGGLYDQIKVLDFGLVAELRGKDETRLTQADMVRGTPAYIAPERLRDPQIHHPSVDIYAVGAVAYNLLTAKDVYEADTSVAVVSKALTEQPISPSALAPDPLPGTLESLVLDCLKKNPAERPASIKAIQQQLGSLAAAHPWTQEDARKCQPSAG